MKLRKLSGDQYSSRNRANGMRGKTTRDSAKRSVILDLDQVLPRSKVRKSSRGKELSQDSSQSSEMTLRSRTTKEQATYQIEEDVESTISVQDESSRTTQESEVSGSVFSSSLVDNSIRDNRTKRMDISMSKHSFEDSEHVTIWNSVEHRKIAGNAAPLAKNLKRYFEKHPECEIYVGQDMEYHNSHSSEAQKISLPGGSSGGHISIWNRVEKRKIAGNAAPLWKNLESYLEKHPECEVYNGQDRELLERRKQKRKHIRSNRRMNISGKRPPVFFADRSFTPEAVERTQHEVRIEESVEEKEDIVIVKNKEETEMSFFVSSFSSDPARDLACVFGLPEDLHFSFGSSEKETNHFDSLWRQDYLNDIVVLGCDNLTQDEDKKNSQDEMLNLSEEELSLLNEDLDISVDFSSNSSFVPAVCLSSG
eukprot:jgi/Galph1/6111/GphlegSOOS_G4754.1